MRHVTLITPPLLVLYILRCVNGTRSSRSGIELEDTLMTNVGGLGLEMALQWPWS